MHPSFQEEPTVMFAPRFLFSAVICPMADFAKAISLYFEKTLLLYLL